MPHNLLKYIKYLLLVPLLGFLTPESRSEIQGEWRSHPSIQVATYLNNYHTVKIIPSAKRTYFLVYAQMYSREINSPFSAPHLNLFFHENASEVSSRNFQPVSSLPGGILNCSYSPEGGFLFGVLDNGNTFRINDDGETSLFPPVLQGTMPGALKINDISFSSKENLIWIATSQGLMAIDDRSGNPVCNIRSSEAVNAVGQAGTTLFIAMQRAEGSILMSADIADALPLSIDGFEPVCDHSGQLTGNAVAADRETIICTSDIIRLTDNTISFIGPSATGSGRALNLLSRNSSGGSWTPLTLISGTATLVPDATFSIHPFEGFVTDLKDFCSVHMQNFYSFNKGVDPDLSLPPAKAVDSFKQEAAWRRTNVETDFRGVNLQTCKGAPYSRSTYWFYLPHRGFVRRTANLNAIDSDGPARHWTGSSITLVPNAPGAHHASYMTWHPDYGVLVRSKSVNNLFGYETTPVYDHLSAYRNGEWRQIGLADISYENRQQHYNAIGILVDPDNPGYVYSASNRSGILRLDPDHTSDFLIMTCGDHFSADNKSKVKISPDVDNVKSSHKAWAGFSEPKPDAYGNIWTSWFSLVDDDPASVCLMYWEPSDRLASKTAASFRPWKTLRFNAGVENSNKQILLPLVHPGNENLLVYSPGNYGSPVIIFNHSGTPGNPADDRMTVITDPYDEQGRHIDYDWISGFFEDPYDGRVWLMTQSGLFWFRPGHAFADNRILNRLVMSDAAEYNGKTIVLENGGVISMTSDPRGRKWIGSQNGGLYYISEDCTTLLARLDTDNSGLADNTILSLTWNHDNSSLMVATLKGIQEFFPADGRQDRTERVSAIPPVVEPDYMGCVTITDLDNSASYKAVNTTTGRSFNLPRPKDGIIRWDLFDNDDNRAPAGKYIVCRSDSDTSLTTFLII